MTTLLIIWAALELLGIVAVMLLGWWMHTWGERPVPRG